MTELKKVLTECIEITERIRRIINSPFVPQVTYSGETVYMPNNTPMPIEKLLRKLYELTPLAKKYNANLCERINKNISNLTTKDGGLNPYQFGAIINLLGFLDDELKNNSELDVWQYIHPRISQVSKNKMTDGHCADAAESALKEICSRIRTIRANNNAAEIKSDSDMMRKTFGTETPLLKFNNLSNLSKRNIQEGYTQMLAGAMQAIRNPNAHANLQIDEDDAMRKLMFASDLMYKIDEAILHSGISE